MKDSLILKQRMDFIENREKMSLDLLCFCNLGMTDEYFSFDFFKKQDEDFCGGATLNMKMDGQMRFVVDDLKGMRSIY
jgi:hypothetical protein